MLEIKITTLTKAIEALTAALEAQSLSAPVEVVEAQIGAVVEIVREPEAAPAIDIDAVTALALKASRNGHGDAIKTRLVELGAPRISKLDADGLAVFAEWLEGLDQ